MSCIDMETHFFGVEKEVSMFWDEDGLRCKGRLDIAPSYIDRQLVFMDLKTTDKVNPRKWMNDIARDFGHLQAAHYMRGWEVLSGETIENMRWIWIVAEVSPPYGVYLVEADTTMKVFALDLRSELMERYRNYKPGQSVYGDEIMIASLPSYMMKDKE
jgi:hypothetical protein